MLIARRGYTILETVIVLSLGALVISLGASVALRQQRFHRDLVITVERTEQIEQIVAMMPISIRSIAPGEGDIAPGNARDTSLEFRATIASGVACDSTSASTMLAPAVARPRLLSTITRPEAGDTAWALELSDSTERWSPHAIVAVSDTVGTCSIAGAAPIGGGPRTALLLALSAPRPRPGSPIRITRPWRYSLYRAADGAWYLGGKDWNAALARFNTIQPVAGPFLSAAASGLRFTYLDSTGTTLPPGMTNTRPIAVIEVAFRTDSGLPGRYAHSASVHGRSASVIGLRNRGR